MYKGYKFKKCHAIKIPRHIVILIKRMVSKILDSVSLFVSRRD